MPRKPKTKRRSAGSAATPRGSAARDGCHGPRRDVLMLQVLTKAEALFASRGIASTSLQDIATEIGLSRTSIYYYFSSKDALLQAVVRGVAERTAALVEDFGGSPHASSSAQLAATAQRLVLWMTDPQTSFRLLDRNEGDLPGPMAAAHRETRRRVSAAMVAVIEHGIAAGEFRAVDPGVTAAAIIGMCNWTATSHAPMPIPDREKLAKQIAALAVASVRKCEAAGGGHDVKTLAASIRENLGLIERLALRPREPTR